MGNMVVPASDTVSGDLDLLDVVRTNLAGAKLDLYKSGFVPTPDSLAADFVAQVCTFTGYAQVVLTWSPVAVTADGKVVIVSSRAFFQGSDPLTVTDTVGGAVLTDGTGKLIRFYQFPAPVNIDAALKFIAMELSVSMSGGEADVEF